MEKGTLESLLCIPPSGRGPTHLDGNEPEMLNVHTLQLKFVGQLHNRNT